MVKLFVYGTLRDGFSPARLLGKDARLIEKQRKLHNFAMYDMGMYPCVIEQADSFIIGDVFEIDKTAFRRLDAYEAVPELYERRFLEEEGFFIYIYVQADDTDENTRILSGDWKDRKQR